MYQLLPAGMSSEINKTKGTDWLQSARNPPVQLIQRSWIFPPFPGDFFRSWINNAESELKFKDPTKTNILNPQSDWFVVQGSLNYPNAANIRLMLEGFPYNSALLWVGTITTPWFLGLSCRRMLEQKQLEMLDLVDLQSLGDVATGGWTNQDFMGMGCFFLKL